MTKLFCTSLDADIGAMTLWQEARGQGPDAMALVANVIKNRTLARYFSGGTVGSTCWWPAQFSGWGSARDRIEGYEWLNNKEAIPSPDFVMRLFLAVCEDKWEVIQPWAGQALNYYSPAGLSEPPDWAAQMFFLGETTGFRFYKPMPSTAA